MNPDLTPDNTLSFSTNLTICGVQLHLRRRRRWRRSQPRNLSSHVETAGAHRTLSNYPEPSHRTRFPMMHRSIIYVYILYKLSRVGHQGEQTSGQTLFVDAIQTEVQSG
ncbi:hypothetical protein DPEC_G00195080 [Dallia pectoralis]|uniref:Uncharacterized protein n=1 Tax=Dallia pectoralis TaxID=75939 RepID=A0ACC2G7E0_DALPE|nr:hypothetical protein DPEC_G00195080 [Dallia pectoralis]